MPDGWGAGLAGLRELMAPWRGARAWVVPMVDRAGKPLGNNGDELMRRVFELSLVELEIRVVPWGQGGPADLIIVPPNGALLEVYRFPDLLASRLSGFPDVPVVIFPSSAWFPTRDPAFVFGGRTAPTTWILRESRSMDHLSGAWGSELHAVHVTLELDRDVVAAAGARVVASIVGDKPTVRFPLVAARGDAEAKDMSVVRRPSPATRVFARARRVLARDRQDREGLVRGRALLLRVPDLSDELIRSTETVWTDPSDTRFHTFDEYCALVTGAHTVVTDRLHVALPAAILGAEVYLVDAGYHKLSGVYSTSLADLRNARLITT